MRRFVDSATLLAMGIEHNSSVLAILDDDESVQIALQDLIESEGLSALCFGSAEQFLDSTARYKASCLISDVRMPGMSGLELQEKLKSERCPLPIIFISARGDIPMAVRAIQGGAIDFLTKPFRASELIEAINEAISQDRISRLERAELAKLRQRFSALTPREREVLPLVASGLLNKQAAAELGISEVTLQIHRGRVMQKMEAASLADLVRTSDNGGRK